MHYLDPALLLELRGKAKVMGKLKLLFVVLLLVFPPLPPPPLLIFPMLLNRLLSNSHIM